MEIKLRTLTPLWTGGVDQTCDRLHETGLIGSLRWWYEALVRGLGGSACDPTEQACTFDEEKYRKSTATEERQRLRDAGLCDACQLFGATGWARRFRLEVKSDGNTLLQQGDNVLIPGGRVHQSKQGRRAGGWYVFGKSRVGTIEIKIIPLNNADLCPLHTVLTLFSQHASLGPKGASGYGIIQVENVQPDVEWIDGISNHSPARNSSLPDFRDFFFARFQFQSPKQGDWWRQINGIQQAVNGKLAKGSSPRPLRSASQELKQIYKQDILPIAPAIRNWLRYQWQHGLDRNQEQYVFGDAHSAIGSKVLVSYAYRPNDDQDLWEFRIWGWLPCAEELPDRDGFLNTLKEQFQSGNIWKFVFGGSGAVLKIVAWHALDCSQTDGQAYLKELLGGAP